MSEDLQKKIDRYEQALTAIEDEGMKIITENMSEQALKGLTIAKPNPYLGGGG